APSIPPRAGPSNQPRSRGRARLRLGGRAMKKLVGGLAIAVAMLLPGAAFAGGSTDAALGLGAFAVFNQILGGGGSFGRPAVVAAPAPVVYAPPPVVYAPPPVYVAPPPPVYVTPPPVVYAPVPLVFVRPAPGFVRPA